MRIALFTETYLPHVNGIVTHVKSLKDGLERLGHEVLIVTADADARRHFVADGILHCPARASKRPDAQAFECKDKDGSLDMISRCLCQQRA